MIMFYMTRGGKDQAAIRGLVEQFCGAFESGALPSNLNLKGVLACQDDDAWEGLGLRKVHCTGGGGCCAYTIWPHSYTLQTKFYYYLMRACGLSLLIVIFFWFGIECSPCQHQRRYRRWDVQQGQRPDWPTEDISFHE